MMKAFLAISFFFFTINAFSQTSAGKNPGGVKGATHWFKAEIAGKQLEIPNNIRAGASLNLNTLSNIGFINKYPAFVLNGNNNLSTSLGKNDINAATYFTVYQSTDKSKEYLIWNIEKNKKTQLVLTTSRMVDIDENRYMNFSDLSPSTPKINIYQQSKTKDTAAITEQKMLIGQVPVSPEIPVSDFRGLIPEIILYNRLLSKEERLRVASYLALKYGITLDDPSSNYLNSSGQILWNGKLNSQYNYNIAGIGRDDSSDFFQKTSSSTNTPALLAVSATTAIENNNFLMWGDNGEPITNDVKTQGLPALFKKKWLFNSNNKNQVYEGELIFDTKQMLMPSSGNDVFWMAIDYSGIGDFSLSTIEYQRMNKIDDKQLAYFKLPVDKTGSAKKVISFMVTRNLNLATNVIMPTCLKPNTGKLLIKILGGRAPYKLSVDKNKANLFTHYINETNATDSISGLANGKYFLKITDVDQQTYIDSLYINNSDGPVVNSIVDRYELKSGSPLQIEASGTRIEGVSYYWSGPNGFSSNEPVIQAREVGSYTLELSRNGCSFNKDFEVYTEPLDDFTYDVVYPNPSSGAFQVKVNLNRTAPISLSVYTSGGKQVLFKEADGSENYLFTNTLTSKGVFLIVLRSGKSVKSHKLFID